MCIRDRAEGEPIGPGCGVFVQAGEAGNGSQTSPYGSVTEAVANIGDASSIYICGGESFTGSIQLASNISVYGGLDCASWRFQVTNPRPEIVGDADVPAITISGSGSGELSHLRITAAPAVTPGASSIAVLSNASETAIADSELTAASVAAGEPGEPQTKAATPAEADGKKGEIGCDGTTMSNIGGDPGTNTCGIGVDGGFGGNGTNSTTAGGTGDPGQPAGGNGGAGETTSVCGNGGQGANGAAGMAGAGAAPADTGLLSGDGYVPPSAPSGQTAGGFGQGGGGGGGAKQCSGAGHGGGGGGAGGCGGNPGNGGRGGGGSFALVSIEAAITLVNVKLVAGLGGSGGPGDAGQDGMDGGAPGDNGGTGACLGGPGGDGGRGGAGGGGRGGPSVGIAYTGDAPTEMGTIDITIPSTPAPGGAGGNGGAGNIGGTGADGILEERLSWE